MIGAEETGEVGFMNALPHKDRPAAVYLINQFELVDLVDIFFNGPTLQLQQSYSLPEDHWQQVIHSVLLTRLTMFHPNRQYPKQYQKFILNLAFKAYSRLYPEAELKMGEIAEHAERETPFFSQWFKQLLAL